jgi:aminopeptidase N
MINLSDDNSMKTEFNISPIMSNYLVAIVISDFKCLNKTIDNAGEYGKIDVRMCGRSNAINQLQYALEISVNIIKFYDTIFDAKYPLPKLGNLILSTIKQISA